MNTNAEGERWLALDDLFQRASAMDASHGAAFLDDACGADSGLRNEVERLLAFDKTLSWLKRPVDRAARNSRLCRRIGPYVLLRLLGEGGMGRVFLAARADELGRCRPE